MPSVHAGSGTQTLEMTPYLWMALDLKLDNQGYLSPHDPMDSHDFDEVRSETVVICCVKSLVCQETNLYPVDTHVQFLIGVLWQNFKQKVFSI